MARQLYVFGSNGQGQLGIPAADMVHTPTILSHPPPLAGLRIICGGDNHTLVLTAQGQVFGVGDNRKAQLIPGPGLVSRLETFTPMGAGFRFAAATCESSALILAHDTLEQSMVHTRGAGPWGELGYESRSRSRSRSTDDQAASDETEQQPPILIALPGKVVDFSAGAWHYVAILDDGSVYGWGKARLGQLGDDLSAKVQTPSKIAGIPFKPAKATCGKDFTYLVGEPGTGEHIVLGRDKFNLVSHMPNDVKGWKDIGATWHAIFVLFQDGTLIAWGRNAIWDLLPPNLPPIDKIAVGSEHVLALTLQGELLSWGWSKHGNCGDLADVQEKVNNDMVSGFWNVINLPAKVEAIGAGFCTSFVVTQ
ncbi:alpha tubulin suppressor [Pleosporales sp. CAS-2024a]